MRPAPPLLPGGLWGSQPPPAREARVPTVKSNRNPALGRPPQTPAGGDGSILALLPCGDLRPLWPDLPQ